jgi:hypothetical protein
MNTLNAEPVLHSLGVPRIPCVQRVPCVPRVPHVPMLYTKWDQS